MSFKTEGVLFVLNAPHPNPPRVQGGNRTCYTLEMNTCIFCKIVAGEIPSYKVYEDENVLAFLDIHPVSTGHTLLVPKTHYEWMQDAPDDVISFSFLKTKMLINKIKEKLDADYVQVSVVGKDIPHFHIHLIPRKLEDNIDPKILKNLEENEFEKVLQKLNS